ncbi:hypothetical protein BJQ89_03152 [Arthrobacter sp. ES1]|nr:hypothetical protein [Arthrobacter sp. ES1]
MGLSADRTIKGMTGGGIVMRTLETQRAVRACPGVSNGRGQDQVAAAGDLPRQDQVFRQRSAAPVDAGVRLFGGGLCWGEVGVDSVHTLGKGPGRTGAGPGRIGNVSAGSQCLQGLEPGSSPTSGTCFPWSGACGQLSVHKLSTYFRGPFLLVAVAVVGVVPPPGSGSGVAAYLFMAGSAWNGMSCCGLGIKSSWSFLSAAGMARARPWHPQEDADELSHDRFGVFH